MSTIFSSWPLGKFVQNPSSSHKACTFPSVLQEIECQRPSGQGKYDGDRRLAKVCWSPSKCLTRRSLTMLLVAVWQINAAYAAMGYPPMMEMTSEIAAAAKRAALVTNKITFFLRRVMYVPLLPIRDTS